MRIGDSELTVSPDSHGDLSVIVRRQGASMVTWIAPRRFRACPRFVAQQHAGQMIEALRLRLRVEDLATALEAECRRALGMAEPRSIAAETPSANEKVRTRNE